MTWLDHPGAFETQINSYTNLYRTSNLKAVVAAMAAAEKTQGDAELYEVAPALYKWRQSDPHEFKNRFGEDRYQELMSELLEARRRQRFGIPLVIDPPSHPGYEPDLWNDGQRGLVQSSTNCYAYACNDSTGHRPAQWHPDGRIKALFTPQPGQFAEKWGHETDSTATGSAAHRERVADWIDAQHAQRRPGFTSSDIRFKVMMDDQMRRSKMAPFLIGKDQDPINIPGYYLVALVVCGDDYHWLRQDDNSYWSHKPGISPVKDKDDANKFIWDPRNATYRDPPYRFVCFYQLPKGGVKTWSLGDKVQGPF